MRHIMIACARVNHSSAQLLVDRAVHWLLDWTMPPLFYALDPRYRLPQLRQHLRAEATVTFDQGSRWQPIPVYGPAGLTIVPHLSVRGTLRPERPLLVWHHGAGEFPVNLAIDNAYDCAGLDLPLVLVRAAGHHQYRQYQRQMRTSTGAGLMLAASILAMEQVRRAWPGPIILGGLSLGGMVAAYHAAWFGDQIRAPTRWAPVAAGPDMAAVLLRSGFSRLTASTTRAHERAGQLLEHGVAGLPPGVERLVHPLLGQWDLVHCLRAQAAAWRAWGVRPRVVPRSHIGLSVDGHAIGNHLRNVSRLLQL